MGSNNTETKFRVLKIDRMEPRELHIVDDKVVCELMLFIFHVLLVMIDKLSEKQCCEQYSIISNLELYNRLKKIMPVQLSIAVHSVWQQFSRA